VLYSSISICSMYGIIVSICMFPMSPVKKISSMTSLWRDRSGESRRRSFENRFGSSGCTVAACSRSSVTSWSQIRFKYSELTDSWSKRDFILICSLQQIKYLIKMRMKIIWRWERRCERRWETRWNRRWERDEKEDEKED